MNRILGKRRQGLKNETIIKWINNNKYKTQQPEGITQQKLCEQNTRKKKKTIQE